jgi:hypothetical protein
MMTDYLQLITDSLIFLLPLSYNSSLTLTFHLSLSAHVASLSAHIASLSAPSDLLC